MARAANTLSLRIGKVLVKQKTSNKFPVCPVERACIQGPTRYKRNLVFAGCGWGALWLVQFVTPVLIAAIEGTT